VVALRDQYICILVILGVATLTGIVLSAHTQSPNTVASMGYLVHSRSPNAEITKRAKLK